MIASLDLEIVGGSCCHVDSCVDDYINTKERDDRKHGGPDHSPSLLVHEFGSYRGPDHPPS